VGETCNLTILDGNQVLYLDRVETPMPLRLHLEPGTRVPLHLRGAASAIADAMAPLNKQASHVTQSDSAELL
jgi:DNA-binding IclR family transcriptional regulator